MGFWNRHKPESSSEPPYCIRCMAELVPVRRWGLGKWGNPEPADFRSLGCPNGCDQHAYVSDENKAAVMALLKMGETHE